MTEHPAPTTEPVVATLFEEWAAIDALLAGLDNSEWSTPTTLPGWSVHDVVAHLIGTESRLAGEQELLASFDPSTLAHVRNTVGASNERWVRSLRAAPPEEMRQRFREITRRRAEMLTAMGREEFDVNTQTPIGPAPYRRFMGIRVFDCWLHEQDIRDVVKRPGHEDGPCAEESVEEVVRALGFIVGKQAAAPQGSTITFELTGPVHRTMHVVVEGRAQVVPDLDRPASATLLLSSTLFVRLAGGRADAVSRQDTIRFDGDRDLGQRVAQNLPYTI